MHYMHHKNIKCLVRKQLKNEFPHWKRLTKKEKMLLKASRATENWLIRVLFNTHFMAFQVNRRILLSVSIAWCVVFGKGLGRLFPSTKTLPIGHRL